jgi:hypothetical protein
MKETELAYIAGIIDGEGSVKIYKSHSRTYDVSVEVSMINELIPTWLHAAFGDRIRIKALQIKGQRLSKDAVQT